MSKQKIKPPVASPPVTIKPKPDLFQQLEALLGAKQKLVVATILSLSLLFRVIYFIQLNSGPCIWQHRFEESDMHFYDEWAKKISHDSWLSDFSFHQFNAPQQWIADYYFKKHPPSH